MDLAIYRMTEAAKKYQNIVNGVENPTFIKDTYDSFESYQSDLLAIAEGKALAKKIDDIKREAVELFELTRSDLMAFVPPVIWWNAPRGYSLKIYDSKITVKFKTGPIVKFTVLDTDVVSHWDEVSTWFI